MYFTTDGRERTAHAGNRECTVESQHGSAELPAVRVNEVILFFQRQAEYLRELAYNFQEDGYVAPNMCIPR